MIRILSVSLDAPTNPPRNAVPNRQWHLYSNLGYDTSLCLLSFCAPDEHNERVTSARDLFDDVLVYPLTTSEPGITSRLANRARFVAGGLAPYAHHDLMNRRSCDVRLAARIEQEVGELDLKSAFDLVVFEEEAARFIPLPRWLSAPLTCHRLEVFSEALADQARTSAHARLEWWLEQRAWRRFDRAIMKDLAMAFPSSQEIDDAIATITPSVPRVVVLNGADLDVSPLAPSEGLDVVMIGSMDGDPNIDGARWFTSRIWPRVSAAIPGSQLRIVGRNPARSVRRLAGPTVKVTGAVDDVSKACRGARVAVVPVRIGMGIKTKTLHAMSLGLPVVSTRRGAEGISASPTDGLICADDENRFAAEVVRLLQNPDLADRLGSAARSYLGAHHSWAAAGRTYGEALLEAIQAPVSR